MLNTRKIKATGGNRVDQPLIAAGSYPARVAQIIDLGVQPRKAWKGTEKSPVDQIWFTLELPTEFMLDADGNEEKDRPRWLSRKINMFSSTQENAVSTKFMEALDPTGELEDDWGKLLGFPCTVIVTHSKDGKYCNIGSISPVMKGMKIDELQNEAKLFDLENPDMELYEDLPEFLKEMISSNLNFKGSTLEQALTGGTVEEEEVDEERPY